MLYTGSVALVGTAPLLIGFNRLEENGYCGIKDEDGPCFTVPRRELVAAMRTGFGTFPDEMHSLNLSFIDEFSEILVPSWDAWQHARVPTVTKIISGHYGYLRARHDNEDVLKFDRWSVHVRVRFRHQENGKKIQLDRLFSWVGLQVGMGLNRPLMGGDSGMFYCQSASFARMIERPLPVSVRRTQQRTIGSSATA